MVDPVLSDVISFTLISAEIYTKLNTPENEGGDSGMIMRGKWLTKLPLRYLCMLWCVSIVSVLPEEEPRSEAPPSILSLCLVLAESLVTRLLDEVIYVLSTVKVVAKFTSKNILLVDEMMRVHCNILYG